MSQYEGLAYEASRAFEIGAVVFVVSIQGDLYELAALAEPVVQKAYTANEPAALPNPLEYRDD